VNDIVCPATTSAIATRTHPRSQDEPPASTPGPASAGPGDDATDAAGASRAITSASEEDIRARNPLALAPATPFVEHRGVIVIVMGVSGCGKTTVGRALAGRLGCEFLDADDFHPPENVAKMRGGTPLTDADRAGWLARLRAEIEARLASGANAVLACSALRESYRARLRRPGEPVHLAYLRGDFDTIAARLAARAGHYMPPSLLRSQFATLEEPGPEAIVVPVELPPEQAVARILAAIMA
jgi:gluconokinase